MSISMSRPIASTRSVSSGTRPNTSQNHAAAAARSATASPTWSSRKVRAAPDPPTASGMDVQPFRAGGQVRREAAGRVALRAYRGQPGVRVVGQEPVLAPGEVRVAEIDAGAVGGQRGRPAVHPAGVLLIVGRVRGD